MKRTLRRHRLSFLAGVGAAGVAALVLARTIAHGQPPPKAPPQPPANNAKADRPKATIELSAKRLLARQTAPAPVGAVADFVNPKVEPGKVRWHKDFDTACRAAETSGKPVLLFQMMGKLDDRFC